MKRIFLSLLLLNVIAINTVSAYWVTIRNQTDGQVQVDIAYGGAGICAKESKTVDAGQTAQIDTKICCPNILYFLPTSGRAKTQNQPWVEFNPPATGFGIACRDFTVVLKNRADGYIIAEQA